ncbi:hypothetical protein B2J96_05490 [Mycobacterium shigaense]|nr:hypothetical protein B2J96_05490 [Mycobacterium shigaense]
MTQANDDLRGVVTIGASAGGVEALTNLAAELPDDLPYAGYPWPDRNGWPASIGAGPGGVDG